MGSELLIMDKKDMNCNLEKMESSQKSIDANSETREFLQNIESVNPKMKIIDVSPNDESSIVNTTELSMCIVNDPNNRKMNQVFQCQLCERKFSSRAKIEDHFILDHGSEKLYNCSICDSSYSYEKNLKTHFKKRHSTNYKTTKTVRKLGMEFYRIYQAK